MRHNERHRTGRIGLLRAAVLGANDGIISTASLIVGVAAAAAFRTSQEEDVQALPEGEFWARLSTFFTRRGWGTLAHVPRHQAVGVLTSTD